MKPHIPRRVMIWIDHEEAILITLAGKNITGEDEIFSEAGPHTHGGGSAQYHIQTHRYETLKHYYEEIVQHLAPVDEILILGPG